MGASIYRTYEEAANDYLIKFRSLRDAPPMTSKAATRGAGEIPEDKMIDHADAIADVSADMVELSKTYIESSDATVREGISGQLIAQATAELQVAIELLQISEEKKSRSVATTRAVRGAQLKGAISTLEKSMATPPTLGLPVAKTRRRAGGKPSTVEEAKIQLQKTAEITTTAMVRRVQELGGDIAFDLVMQTEWGAVTSGAGLLGKEIIEKLEVIKKGVGVFLARAVSVAAKTLYNVYCKIMALLGREIEDQARDKVKEWLDKVKEEGKIDLFEILLAKFYRVESFKETLQGWLSKTTAEIDAINKTVDEVTLLGEKFTVLVGRMSTLANVINLGKLIKLPQVLLVVAAIQLALLAVLVYAGFDYIGYRQPRFPNMAKGVAEVIAEGVAATA